VRFSGGEPLFIELVDRGPREPTPIGALNARQHRVRTEPGAWNATAAAGRAPQPERNLKASAPAAGWRVTANRRVSARGARSSRAATAPRSAAEQGGIVTVPMPGIGTGNEGARPPSIGLTIELTNHPSTPVLECISERQRVDAALERVGLRHHRLTLVDHCDAVLATVPPLGSREV